MRLATVNTKGVVKTTTALYLATGLYHTADATGGHRLAAVGPAVVTARVPSGVPNGQ
jgi:hypothetical protein